MKNSSLIKDPEISRKEKTLKITIVVLMILLIFSLYFIFNTIPGTAGVRISVNPEKNTIMKGQDFYVDIYIDPGKKPVSAVQFSLFFNNSILKIKDVQQGDFLRINETQTIFSPGKINNTGGALLNVFGTMIKPGGSTTMSNAFARITMNSEYPGVSGIELRNVIVSGPDSKQYVVKILNGSVEVGE